MEKTLIELGRRECPESCIKTCDGKGIVAIFRDLCLGAIDIEERRKLCDKIKFEMDAISETLSKEQVSILRHYMGNLILAYSTMAVELPAITGKEFQISPKSSLNFTTCDVHRIIFGVVRLFETGTLEEKNIFINRLTELYQKDLLHSANAVLDALELIYV